MTYRLGMLAGEARAEGLEVASHVPDCAEMIIDGYDAFGPPSVEFGDGMGMKINFTANAAWSWVEGTISFAPIEETK